MARRIGFPQHRCCGFIEASSTNILSFASTVCFPQHRCCGFIEAGLVYGEGAEVLAFPQHRCCGFIEAMNACCCCIAMPQLSAASVLRLH